MRADVFLHVAAFSSGHAGALAIPETENGKRPKGSQRNFSGSLEGIISLLRHGRENKFLGLVYNWPSSSFRDRTHRPDLPERSRHARNHDNA